MHSLGEFHKLDITSLMCCVTSVCIFTHCFYSVTREPKLWQQYFEVHWISALCTHHGMLLDTVASVSVSFHLFARKMQSFNTLHRGCCLRKFFGAKEVRNPSNISRCTFRKKKSTCNLIKCATTGALKHHWSTGESAKEKCFQCTCTCRFKKRSSSSTL